jgi:hypothetical protein
MRRSIIFLALTAIIALSAFAVSGQAPESPRQGLLSALKEGQSVTVKQMGGRYEITAMDNIPAPLGHTVIEIGPDWLTVEDIAGIIETRIPLYSITAIVRLKVPSK